MRCTAIIIDAASLLGLVGLPDSDAEGGEEASGHEGPVAGAEPLAARVEGQVGVGALGVVVGRGEAGSGCVESTLGDQLGGGAGGGAGQHLDCGFATTGCG